jgi:Tol biopolymer transport system component
MGVAASLVLGLGSAIYLWRSPGAAPTTVSLEDLQIVQLTTSGLAERPAISPDGKYVAYIQHDGDGYSLRLRQITTGRDVEIVAAEPRVTLEGVTVTPDANFVDFVQCCRNAHRELWRVPLIGGRPKRLNENVTSPVGWSRDGRHMAFVRYAAAQGASELVIADADGTQEHVLATRRGSAGFDSLFLISRPNLPPAWSPDGRAIAVFAWAGSDSAIAVVDVAAGSARDFVVNAGGRGGPRGLAWLDTQSLVLNIPPEPGAAGQLLRLSYPDGGIARLSNDPNTYESVSVTADGTSLVTARSESRVSIWVGDATGNRGADVIRPVPQPRLVNGMVAWTQDRLLYAAAGNVAISIVSPDGGLSEEIVPGGSTPATTWDGEVIVFADAKSGAIWKTDSQGRQAVELVSKTYLPRYPVVTSDRQVVFVTNQGFQAPWIVSLDGGAPRELAHVFAAIGSVDVSPNGRFLAFRSQDAQNKAITMICDLPSCTMPRTLPPLGRPSPLRWTPDGNIAFVDSAAPSNIWVRPLDGSAPYQLTDFTDRTIVDFAWSRDGKQLAIARASTTNDIVLFKGLKK